MPRYYQGTLRNMIYRLRKFKPYVEEYLVMYLSSAEVEDLLTSAVANSQLYRRGIEGFGRKIMDYAPYAPYTIRLKKEKGQPHTRVTLKDTGAFYEGFVVIATSEGFYITSTDEKTEALTEKYGDSIFRLTRDNFNRFLKAHVRKDLVKYLKSKYNIKTR